MKKKLLFYWYVPEDEWPTIYDIHLKNLNIYKDIFDEQEFIISIDCGVTDLSCGQRTIGAIKGIFPDAKFTVYQNDKELRESKYFYEEIVKKLDKFDSDTAIFFAHSKGANTKYVSFPECVRWIDAMYYYNLRMVEETNNLLSDEKTCAIGAFRLCNTNLFETTNWFYPGTYFWIVPNRIKKYITDNNVSISDDVTRYYAEGWLGTIFAQESTECVSIKGDKGEDESFRHFIKYHSNEDEKRELVLLYGDFMDFKNEDALDIFVFTHKTFKTERTNPVYTIVSSSEDDVTSDNLRVIKLGCRLSNIGFNEWQKIFELYNIWPNLKDYVGLAHYHRYLKFSEDINFVPDADELFKSCEFVVKKPCFTTNLRENYAVCHNVKDYDIMMNIIKERYPDYYETAKECEERGVIFDSNIMILKRKDFVNLCHFVFSVLFEYCKEVGINPGSDDDFLERVKSDEEGYSHIHPAGDKKYPQQARICAFLAERVSTFFIYKNFTMASLFDMTEE